MTNLTDIQFDHSADFSTQRGFGVPITHEQNGVIFAASFRPIKFAPQKAEPEVEPKIEKPKKEKIHALPVKPLSARERAAEKLKGFVRPETADAVRTAIDENTAAAAAEEQAQ